MKTDNYGELLINEDELCALILKDSNILDKVTQIVDPEQFNKSNKFYNNKFALLEKKNEISDIKTILELDKINQECWFMPEEYKTKDILKVMLDLCNSETERNRIIEEYAIFEKKGLVNVLKFAHYLVEIAKQNNIVLGVGRGSSTSCYCLFKLQLHRIDSLQYNLDIKEFFKE